jgi:hypothetical protein
MSVLTLKVDIDRWLSHVCFVPQADIGDEIIFPVFGFILVKIRELATPPHHDFMRRQQSNTLVSIIHVTCAAGDGR